MGRLIILALPIALIVYAFIDVLTTPAHSATRGPKALWAIAVLVLPVVGALLWFILGRPRRSRASAPSRAPDDDVEFLRELDRRTKHPDEDSPEH